MKTTIYRLGDVCKLRNGYAFKSENFSTQGIPIIRISNIYNDIASTNDSLKTNESTVFEKFVVKKGDILIAMSGATTGKFGRYDSDEKAYQNQRVGCFVITDKEKLSNDYLYLLLKNLKKTIEKDAYGGGQPNISSTIIENYKIQLPSLNDQLCISTILNKAEGLIKLRERSIDMLDIFAKMKFLEMFGNLPSNSKGFEEGKIGDVVTEVKYGTSKPSEDNGEFVYLRMNNITTNGYWDFDNLKFINVNKDDKEKYVVRNGDLVFNRTNSKELVGKTAIYDREEEMIIAGYLIRIRLNSKANPYYVWGYLNSSHGKNILLTLCRNIVGMANINAQELQGIKILIPPIELQNSYELIVKNLKTMKELLIESKIQLERLFNSLSQRAFRGDLNFIENVWIAKNITPDLETDENKSINKINEELRNFHKDQSHTGASENIDNKIRQLEAELQIRGEIPFYEEYVKYRLIKGKFTEAFSFDQIWQEITKFPFETLPEYDKIADMLFRCLEGDSPFLRQKFNEITRQIELIVNETAKA